MKIKRQGGELGGPDEKSKAVAQLSLKALGLLIHIISTGKRISAEGLSENLIEGEAAISTALSELRKAGFLTLRTQRMHNGTFSKKTEVTDAGYLFFLRLISNLNLYNEHFPKLFYTFSDHESAQLSSLIPKKKTGSDRYSLISSEGFDGMSDLETEIYREQMKQEKMLNDKLKSEQDRLAFEKLEVKKRKRQFEARMNKPDKTTWTSTDMSFEFADRVEKHWHIKPWRVTQTRFAPINSELRKRYGTNGEIECRMMDRFFEVEEVSKYSDPNFLMNRYFYRFSELEAYARMTTPPTKEEMLAEKELAKKSARWMNKV